MLPDAKCPRFSETLGSWVAPEAEPVCAGHRQDGGASAMASKDEDFTRRAGQAGAPSAVAGGPRGTVLQPHQVLVKVALVARD